MELSAKDKKKPLFGFNSSSKIKKHILFHPVCGLISNKNIRQQKKPIRKVENLDSKHELLLSTTKVDFSH